MFRRTVVAHITYARTDFWFRSIYNNNILITRYRHMQWDTWNMDLQRGEGEITIYYLPTLSAITLNVTTFEFWISQTSLAINLLSCLTFLAPHQLRYSARNWYYEIYTYFPLWSPFESSMTFDDHGALPNISIWGRLYLDCAILLHIQPRHFLSISQRRAHY